MSVLTFERKKLDTTNTVTVDVTVGAVAQQANDFYLPITIDNFTAPVITLTTVTGVAGQNKVTSAIPGYFKDVAVGDIVQSGLTLVAAPASPVMTGIAITALSKIFVYPSTFNSTTLPLVAGDELVSTSLPPGTLVDKIDYVNRLVYMSNSPTVTIIEDITISKPVRITEKNATGTEITVSRNLSIAAGGFSLVIRKGAQEALLGLLKIAPVSSTTSGTVSLQISVYKNRGDKVVHSPNGSGYTTPESLNYVSLGGVTIDADEFLQDAGVLRV